MDIDIGSAFDSILKGIITLRSQSGATFAEIEGNSI